MVEPADKGRLLGLVKIAGRKSRAAADDLERQVIRAADRGCSLRDIAAAAGFDSHHKVQQIVGRARTLAAVSTGTSST